MRGGFHRVHLTIMPIFRFFLQFLVDIMPLGSGSVDPHIFADPDPGSQNLSYLTDPDPHRNKKSEETPLNYIVYYLDYYTTSWLIYCSVKHVCFQRSFTLKLETNKKSTEVVKKSRGW